MKRHLWLSGLLVFVILVLCAGGILLLFKTDKAGNARIQDPIRRLSVEVLELQYRPFTKTVEAYASVSPLRKGTVSAQVGGLIDQIRPDADPGHSVRKGQDLAHIEDTRLRIALEKAKASLEKFRARLNIEQNENERRMALFRSARQRLNLTVSDFERKKTLYNKGLIAKQTLDLAESQVELQKSEFERARSEVESRQAFIKSIQADIASAKADVSKIEEDLEDTVIRAPFDGIIGDRNVELGNQVSPGQALFTVLDISTVKVMARIPSGSVGRIHQGISAEVHTRAYPERTFMARVKQLHPEGDPRNRTFSVELYVDNRQERLLLPGMFARVQIPLYQTEDAVVVPRNAILEDEGGSYVYVAHTASLTARRREVVVEDYSTEVALIREGVKPGDHLIVQGQELLHDGAPIQWETLSDTDSAQRDRVRVFRRAMAES